MQSDIQALLNSIPVATETTATTTLKEVAVDLCEGIGAAVTVTPALPSAWSTIQLEVGGAALELFRCCYHPTTNTVVYMGPTGSSEEVSEAGLRAAAVAMLSTDSIKEMISTWRDLSEYQPPIP